MGGVHVTDFPNPLPQAENPALHRTLEFKSEGPVDKLWYRAAVGEKIEALTDGWYSIGGRWKTRLDGPTKPVLRPSAAKPSCSCRSNWAADR